MLKSVPALATLSDLRARLFHPDSTEAAVAELRRIFKTGTPGAPQQESAADMVARLLGRPVTGPSTSAGPRSIVDQLIKQAVAPSTAPPPNPKQASFLATLDSEISRTPAKNPAYPDFQALESTWRGLDFLVREAGANVKLHAIDISRQELDRQIRPSTIPLPAPSADSSNRSFRRSSSAHSHSAQGTPNPLANRAPSRSMQHRVHRRRKARTARLQFIRLAAESARLGDGQRRRSERLASCAAHPSPFGSVSRCRVS